MTVVISSQGIRTLVDSRALSGVAMLFAAGGLGFVYCRLWLRNARLLVGADVFGYQDLLGTRHTWTGSEVGTMIDARIAYSKRMTQRAVFVLGLDGRRLMAINPIAWPVNAIDRVARSAGKPLDVRNDAISAIAFRREFPRAIPWVSAHSNVTGASLAIVLITLPIALAILLFR